jgi:hypothetical protein
MGAVLIIVFLLFGLFALVVPWIAVAGTIVWLLCFAFHLIIPKKRALFPFGLKRWWLTACIVLCDVAFGFNMAEIHRDQMLSFEENILVGADDLDTTLTKNDMTFQGLPIPAGSIVQCLGYDYVAAVGRVRLSDGTRVSNDRSNELCQARFSRPVTVKGIEFIAFIRHGIRDGSGYVELSRDQEINGKICKQGALARYDGSGGGNEINPEYWDFVECEPDARPITLAAPRPLQPPGFWQAFVAALKPNQVGFYCC